jgi:hypothetical protein
MAFRPNVGHCRLILDDSSSHKATYNSRQDSSGRAISSKHKSLRDTTQRTQQRNINAPGGIRTRNPGRKAAADARALERAATETGASVI